MIRNHEASPKLIQRGDMALASICLGLGIPGCITEAMNGL